MKSLKWIMLIQAFSAISRADPQSRSRMLPAPLCTPTDRAGFRRASTQPIGTAKRRQSHRDPATNRQRKAQAERVGVGEQFGKPKRGHSDRGADGSPAPRNRERDQSPATFAKKQKGLEVLIACVDGKLGRPPLQGSIPGPAPPRSACQSTHSHIRDRGSVIPAAGPICCLQAGYCRLYVFDCSCLIQIANSAMHAQGCIPKQ